MKTAILTILVAGFTALCAAQPLEPAPDRGSADIFLSGALTTADNADTIYQWDIKVTYPKLERRLRRSSHWLVASPAVEFVANKGTNANPDRASVGGAGEVHFYTFPLFGRVLPTVVWSNVVAGEFDRERLTRALSYQTIGRLEFATFFSSVAVPLAFVPRLEGGIELGENYRNRLAVDGSGTTKRLYAGATAYQELGLPWLTLSVTYQVRSPQLKEVFFRKLRDEREVLETSTELRQYLEVAPVLKVGKWFSLKPTFKRGSQPPAFSYVDNELSLSLLFSAKAVSTR